MASKHNDSNLAWSLDGQPVEIEALIAANKGDKAVEKALSKLIEEAHAVGFKAQVAKIGKHTVTVQTALPTWGNLLDYAGLRSRNPRGMGKMSDVQRKAEDSFAARDSAMEQQRTSAAANEARYRAESERAAAEREAAERAAAPAREAAAAARAAQQAENEARAAENANSPILRAIFAANASKAAAARAEAAAAEAAYRAQQESSQQRSQPSQPQSSGPQSAGDVFRKYLSGGTITLDDLSRVQNPSVSEAVEALRAADLEYTFAHQRLYKAQQERANRRPALTPKQKVWPKRWQKEYLRFNPVGNELDYPVQLAEQEVRAASEKKQRAAEALDALRTPNHHRTGILSEDYPADPYRADLPQHFDPYDRDGRMGNPGKSKYRGMVFYNPYADDNHVVVVSLHRITPALVRDLTGQTVSKKYCRYIADRMNEYWLENDYGAKHDLAGLVEMPDDENVEPEMKSDSISIAVSPGLLRHVWNNERKPLHPCTNGDLMKVADYIAEHYFTSDNGGYELVREAMENKGVWYGKDDTYDLRLLVQKGDVVTGLVAPRNAHGVMVDHRAAVTSTESRIDYTIAAKGAGGVVPLTQPNQQRTDELRFPASVTWIGKVGDYPWVSRQMSWYGQDHFPAIGVQDSFGTLGVLVGFSDEEGNGAAPLIVIPE